MIPPAAVATSRPGTRNRRYSSPGTARALPKTYPKNSSIEMLMIWVRISSAGLLRTRRSCRPSIAVPSYANVLMPHAP